MLSIEGSYILIVMIVTQPNAKTQNRTIKMVKFTMCQSCLQKLVKQ